MQQFQMDTCHCPQMVFLVNFQLEFPLFPAKFDTPILWVGTAKACIMDQIQWSRKIEILQNKAEPYL